MALQLLEKVQKLEQQVVAELLYTCDTLQFYENVEETGDISKLFQNLSYLQSVLAKLSRADPELSYEVKFWARNLILGEISVQDRSHDSTVLGKIQQSLYRSEPDYCAVMRSFPRQLYEMLSRTVATHGAERDPGSVSAFVNEILKSEGTRLIAPLSLVEQLLVAGFIAVDDYLEPTYHESLVKNGVQNVPQSCRLARFDCSHAAPRLRQDHDFLECPYCKAGKRVE